MNWILTTLICLSTPISVIDINDALVNQNQTSIVVNVDEVHPGYASTFTYEFSNTTGDVIDIYLISVEAQNNNALTQSIVLKMSDSPEILDVSGLVINQKLTRINKDDTYDFNVDFYVFHNTGNEIQQLSEKYTFIFGVVTSDIRLPSTGHQSRYWIYLVMCGASLMLCGYLIKEGSEDNEKEYFE